MCECICVYKMCNVRVEPVHKINGEKHEETNYDNYAFIAAYLSEKQANRHLHEAKTREQ